MTLCLSSSVMMGTVDKKNGTSVKLRETDPRPKTGIALLKEECQMSGTLNNITPPGAEVIKPYSVLRAQMPCSSLAFTPCSMLNVGHQTF